MQTSVEPGIHPYTQFDIGTCAPTSGDNKHFISAAISLAGTIGSAITGNPAASILAGILGGIWNSQSSQNDYMAKFAECMEKMMHEIVDQTLQDQAAAYINHMSGDMNSFLTSIENKQFNDAANKLSEVSVYTTTILGEFQASSKHELLVHFISDAAVIEATMRAIFMTSLKEEDPEDACSRGEAQLIELENRQDELYNSDGTSLQGYIDKSDFHTKWPNSMQYAGGWCNYAVVVCYGVSWFSTKDTYRNKEFQICKTDCNDYSDCNIYPCQYEENNYRGYCKELSDYAKKTYSDLSSDIRDADTFYDKLYNYIKDQKTQACQSKTTTTTTTTTTQKPGDFQANFALTPFCLKIM